MTSRFTGLVVDCAEPKRLAEFWAAVLGWQPAPGDDEEIELAGPPGSGPDLLFIPVPEPKTVKNRLHIDVNPVGCEQEQEVERLIGLGARRVDVGQGEQSWVVLADPEGNEFCVLRSRVE
ncbi:MAG: VOC family protein [Chloroflexi bacterium]|nr:VOC family protein [Chloroflexota bacterium]